MRRQTVVMSVIAGAVCLAACGDMDSIGSADGAPAGTPPRTMVVVASEPAGAHCANGGQHIRMGRDANRNGVLDANEVVSDSVVCRSTKVATGGIPADDPGAPNRVIVLSSLAPGDAHCAFGGSRQDSGADLDHDGNLERAETTNTAFACNAAPTHVARRGGSGAEPADAVHGYSAVDAALLSSTVPLSSSLEDPGNSRVTDGVAIAPIAGPRTISYAPTPGTPAVDDTVERLRLAKARLFDHR
jgi:hypothetical protein